jgi:hypothetical protein
VGTTNEQPRSAQQPNARTRAGVRSPVGVGGAAIRPSWSRAASVARWAWRPACPRPPWARRPARPPWARPSSDGVTNIPGSVFTAVIVIVKSVAFSTPSCASTELARMRIAPRCFAPLRALLVEVANPRLLALEAERHGDAADAGASGVVGGHGGSWCWDCSRGRSPRATAVGGRGRSGALGYPLRSLTLIPTHHQYRNLPRRSPKTSSGQGNPGHRHL